MGVYGNYDHFLGWEGVRRLCALCVLCVSLHVLLIVEFFGVRGDCEARDSIQSQGVKSRMFWFVTKEKVRIRIRKEILKKKFIQSCNIAFSLNTFSPARNSENICFKCDTRWLLAGKINGAHPKLES